MNLEKDKVNTKNSKLLLDTDIARFERIDYKKRSKVRVFNKNYKNVVFRTYRFNNVELTYDTKYINWANLNCCGGWGYNEKYLASAVQNDSKLFAQVIMYTEDFSGINYILNELIEGNENKVNCIVIDRDDRNFKEVIICKKGCVADYIDIDNIFEQYRILGLELSEHIKSEVRKLASIDMYKYANRTSNEFNFDFANPYSYEELIFNGMLLGYPIESTASILEGH